MWSLPGCGRRRLLFDIMKYGKNLFYKESRKPSIAATVETQIRKGRWTGGNSVKARVGGGKVENGWFGGRSEGVGEQLAKKMVVLNYTHLHIVSER